ncbi:Short-chain dehydrogenase/reductase SDR [Penicillium italicum]|uniref:Short-chain dehydrogenase/reductase SDR n=1 Tax=Penicillium italicum TaxID=40296 RepID=A0A0A2LCP7_PENIT|nr:Short-chain dehydrogenase/reductase SDR [Penicillium italicum]
MDNMNDADLFALRNLSGKTAIVTGGANGIGAETVRFLNLQGVNTVVGDLERTRSDAEILIQSLPHPGSAFFVSVNILVWREMKLLFAQSIQKFGKIDIVVANAGIMESQKLFDVGNVDEHGELCESTEGFRVIDVNLKGTINTLRLALHHMQHNQVTSASGQRGNVVLVTSTSGYFGSTGVGAYIASKHGIVGLLRAAQQAGRELGIRINGVAPFFTPTPTFKALAEKWKHSGLKSNTLEGVATAISLACTRDETGKCYMIAGQVSVEVEDSRKLLLSQWLGHGTAEMLKSASKLFENGSYPLPGEDE